MEQHSRQEHLKIIEKRDQQIELLMAENQLLRQKVDLLVRKVFGSSSEKLPSSQLELFAPDSELGKDCASWKEEASQAESPKPARTTTPRRGERWPENLPVIEQVLDPEAVQASPGEWRCIGADVTEQLDYEPGRFLRLRLVRRKFVHKFEIDGVPVIAPLPPMLQERCTAAPGLLAQIIVGKYADHLPLYRQERIFKSRHGIALPRQNMVRWMELASDWCRRCTTLSRPRSWAATTCRWTRRRSIAGSPVMRSKTAPTASSD